MNYKIYKIQRIDTLDIVYIGITRNKLNVRFSQHFRESKNNKRKVNYFKKYRTLLKIELIKENISSLKKANDLEIFYIKYYKDKGFDLLNATDGGDGTLNLQSWNKGLKCTYKDKLINNSPNSKKIYCYDINGFLINEFNSIKKASEFTNVPRSAIKNIADLKKRCITYKGYSFRYFKIEKIEIKKISKKERLENVRIGKLKNAKKVCVIDKLNNVYYTFDNYIECSKSLKINKNTLSTYFSISKETKKYRFYYEE